MSSYSVEARKARDAFVMAHAESRAQATKNAEYASKVTAELSAYTEQIQTVLRQKNATAVPVQMPVLDERGRPTKDEITYYVRLQKRKVMPTFTGASLACVLSSSEDERQANSRVKELLTNANAVLREHDARMKKHAESVHEKSKMEQSRKRRDEAKKEKEQKESMQKAKKQAIARAKSNAEKAAEAQTRRFENLIRTRGTDT